jgi:hypothetical protein
MMLGVPYHRCADRSEERLRRQIWLLSPLPVETITTTR